MYLTAHFQDSEIECHCGEPSCTKLPPMGQIQPLLDALEALRAITGPIVVNDAYRCPAHNQAVGGVPNSTHTLGLAADIYMPGFSVQKMYDASEKVAGFDAGGIGAYSGKDDSTPRVHVDVRPNGPARWGVDYGETQIAASAVVNNDPNRVRLI